MTVCSTLTSHPHSSLLLDANEHEALALVNPQLGHPCHYLAAYLPPNATLF